MADVFGDLGLFSEFERDREAQGSFIHYDEDTARSRIVFEDFEEDEDSESGDEFANDEEMTPAAEHTDTLPFPTASAGEVVKAEASDIDLSKDSSSISSYKGASAGDEKVKAEESKGEKSSNGSQLSDRKYNEPKLSEEDEKRSAWLNEQLHAEAAEEAKKSNTSAQQLIYERNIYRRYAKILDSTRYVPDDESPAVQLIFNNNSFARKYRQQIEQFIKGLLWEEFHSRDQDSMSEITVKPGNPSCIDINKNLKPETRTERMRQKHALIGNSQFHKQFLIDFLGWPFTVAEPTRCNVNWEIPLYGQVFNEVYADPTNKTKKAPNKKQKPACWNCGEENHAVNDCKQPRNPAKIQANRREFLAQQQNSGGFEPKFTGPARYHLDPELASKFGKFKPGTISDSLRKALGLQDDQLPQHIYKMRLYGYPPGWLAGAKQIQSGVNIFDKNGRVTLITGECLEDGELNEDGNESKTEYDVNKIIEYPGFTVPVPLGFVDEHANFKMPPIQQHQLKKTLMTQSAEKTPSRKRKREKEEEKKVKKSKTVEEGEVVEDDEGSTNIEGEEMQTTEEEEEGEVKNATTPSVDAAQSKPTHHLPRSSSTISLSKDFGTPVLVREKSGLPDASKFGEGIEDHIPFENLPNATGTFEKMRDLIEIIRKKTKK